MRAEERMAKLGWSAAVLLVLGPAGAGRAEEASGVRLMELPGFSAPVPVRVTARSRSAAPAGAPGAEECAGAAGRVDALEAGILDLKARYWASRIREGASVSDLKERPGVHLHSPRLRRLFAAKVRAYVGGEGPAGLSAQEAERFLEADQKARRLERACGAGEFRPAGRLARRGAL